MVPLKAFLEDATRETSASRSGPSFMRDGDHMGHTCRYQGCPKLALGGGKLCVTHSKQSQIANSGLPNDVLSVKSTCPSDSYSSLGSQAFSAMHLSNGTNTTANQDTLNPQRVSMRDSQPQESPGTPGKRLLAKKTARKSAQAPQRVHIAAGASQSSIRPGSFMSNAPRGEPLAHSASAQPPLKKQRTSEDIDLAHKHHQWTVQAPYITEGNSSFSNPNAYPSHNSTNSFPLQPGMSVHTGGQNQNHRDVNGLSINGSVPRTDTSGVPLGSMPLPQHAQQLSEREQSSQTQVRHAESVEDSTTPMCKPIVVPPSTQATYDQLRTSNNQSNDIFPRATIPPTTNGFHSPRGLKESSETNSYQPNLARENPTQQIPAEKVLPGRSQSAHVQQLQQLQSTPHSRPLELASGRPKNPFDQGFFSAVLNTDDISVASQNQDMPPYPTPPSLQRPDGLFADSKRHDPPSRSHAHSGGQSTNGFGVSSGTTWHEVTPQPPQKLSPWMENWKRKNQITRKPSSKSFGDGVQPRDRSGNLSKQHPLAGTLGCRVSNPTPSRQRTPKPATPEIIDLISDDDESAREPEVPQIKQKAVHPVTGSSLHLTQSKIPPVQRWPQESSSPGTLPLSSNISGSNHSTPEYRRQPECASEASNTPYPWAFAAQNSDLHVPGTREQIVAKEGGVDEVRGKGDLVSNQVSDGMLVDAQYHHHHHYQQWPAQSSTGDQSDPHRPSHAIMISVLPPAARPISTTLPVPEKSPLIDHAEDPDSGSYHSHQLPYKHKQKTETEQPRTARLISNAAESSEDKVVQHPGPSVHSKETIVAAPTRRIPTFTERRRAYRHGKFTFTRHGEAALDSYIYGLANDQNRPGSSSYGLPSDTMIEKLEKPVEHWAHLDPRIHWTWPRTQEWHESKMKEISARPHRKSRLFFNNRKAEGKETPVVPPEIVQNNPHWMACLKEFDQLAAAGLAHQESLNVQCSGRAEARLSRTNTGNGENPGDDNSDEELTG